MDKKEFFYELPKGLIAQEPLENRDESRLMLFERCTGKVHHKSFSDIVDILRPGDCIVINDSKVIPARLMSDGGVELLLLERLDESKWSALAKPGRKARPGERLTFDCGRLRAYVEEIVEDGLRVVSFSHEGVFFELLEEIGEMPLPRYIEREQEDTSRYQTVYARHEGSIAAPTAGLHFTENIIAKLEQKGVAIARVTLHVGIGTFRPVKEADITKHHMHSEYCRIDDDAACKINIAKKNGSRVVAIGTTSCRTLESRAGKSGQVTAGAGKTDIFIYPGYEFQVMDGLLTNFHLPESTLIMLVSAIAGRENVLAAYNEAVKEEYRFFSYGDAMLIV